MHIRPLKLTYSQRLSLTALPTCATEVTRTAFHPCTDRHRQSIAFFAPYVRSLFDYPTPQVLLFLIGHTLSNLFLLPSTSLRQAQGAQWSAFRRTISAPAVRGWSQNVTPLLAKWHSSGTPKPSQ